MANNAESSKMRAVTYRRFAEEDEGVDWLVADLLPNVGWCLLIGREGSGKTTLALQLCAALEDGLPFLGRMTQRTSTLYIQADSPAVEWREMVRLIAPHSGGWTLVNAPVGALSNESYVRDLNDLINNKVQPGFVVWDSLYNLAGMSINGENALQPIQTMKLLSANRPWLLIHHPPNEEMRSAGHHSIPANASRVWLLTKNRLQIQKGRLSKLKQVKMSRADDEHGGLWIVDEDNSDLYSQYTIGGIPL